jgi:hypothetical protein
MEQTLSTPIPTRPQAGPFKRAVREFLEANYLYVISAGLMIFGCYLLMRSTPVNGNEFSRILSGLLLLQGYEVLVLGTICLIRRRLPTVEDTLTLVGVEMILLFDPTFFANNFHTMVQGDRAEALGPWVNVGVLALLPLKLRMVEWINGFRLHRLTWAYLLIGAGVVYLAPALLATTTPTLGRTGTLYAVCWLTMAAFVLPPAADGVIAEGRERIHSARHYRWAPRFFLQFPAILILSHLCETWFVHKITFQAALLAPVFLAIGARTFFRSLSIGYTARTILLDLMVLASLVASLPSQGIKPPEVHNLAEPFFVSLLPGAIACVVAAFTYATGYALFQDRWLLLRPALMAVGGALGLLWMTGWLPWILGLAQVALAWIWAHGMAFEIVLIAALAARALWRRAGDLVFLAGCWLLFWIVRLPAVDLYSHLGELVQGFLLLLFVLSVFYGRKDDEAERKLRGLLLTLVIGIALVRAVVAPFEWSHWVVFVESTLLLIAGVANRNAFAWRLGLTGHGAMTTWLLRSWILMLSLPTAVISASLMFFALALYVSFRKEELLRRLHAPARGAGSGQ